MVRGYYSLVQYCPDPSRLEGVNVGIVLFCPAVPNLSARFAERRTAVEHLFGEQDWHFFEVERTALESRLTRYTEEFPDRERFESFVRTRAGALRLTRLRSVKLAEPSEEIDPLFNLLVESRDTPRQTTQGESSNRHP